MAAHSDLSCTLPPDGAVRPVIVGHRRAPGVAAIGIALLTCACTTPSSTTGRADPTTTNLTCADPTQTIDANPRPRTASIVMGGDLLWHNTVWQSAAEDHVRTGHGMRYDWDPMFAALRPTMQSADLAICHTEVPFAAPGEEHESYPVFAAPRSIAPWIASMGWDACTAASNHSWAPGIRWRDDHRRPARGERDRPRRDLPQR
ncbi:hypothetical protein GCM10009795_005450 [Nocardioides hankookensis]|uniref:CapA family protein n=1 Tax=Nocardioides hankookensis TaxID=443157 RepID=A0ABW1LHI7_9ACTN